MCKWGVHVVAGAWRVHCQTANDVLKGGREDRVYNYNFSFCCKPKCYQNVNRKARQVWRGVAIADRMPMNCAADSMRLVLQPGDLQMDVLGTGSVCW